MDEWLSYHKATAGAVATALSISGEITDEEIKHILEAELKGNSIYQDFYMGFPDGTAIMGSGYPIENEYHWWNATQREWYQIALADTESAGITSVYVDTATNDLCLTVAHAVVSDGEVLGVIGIDILVNVLNDMILEATQESEGYFVLLDRDGNVLIHPDPEYPAEAAGDFWKKVAASDGNFKHKDENGVVSYYNNDVIGATGWHMVTVLPERIVTQPIKNVILVVIPISLLIMALAALMIFFVIKKMVSNPLNVCSAFMKKAGTTGDITITPEDVAIIEKYSHINNEIGLIIASSASFVRRITDVSNVLETIASRDLTAGLAPLTEHDVIGNSLQEMNENLNEMLYEINESSRQVSVGAGQVAGSAQSLAQGSTEQASSIEELSGSISDIAEKTRTNAKMAEDAAKLSDAIKENAEKGSLHMNDMAAAVNEISEASKAISKVIKAIDDIAFQTNILALNAAVEAARAGQHGKGFAVVADEVRNLAAKSAEAAKNTGDLIGNSIDKAKLGVQIADETVSNFSTIMSGISENSEIVGRIARSSEEQSLGIEQINTGIDQIVKVIQQNSATAEESAAAAEEMSALAGSLQALIAQFKLKDSGDTSSVLIRNEEVFHSNALKAASRRNKLAV